MDEDDRLEVRRIRESIDPVQNSQTVILLSLQNVEMLVAVALRRHRDQGAVFDVETKKASRQSRYAFAKAKIFSANVRGNFPTRDCRRGDVKSVVRKSRRRQFKGAGELGGR